MEDLEKTLIPANLCSLNAVDNYSGAGANAVSRVDGTSVTSSLFEVVWSPHKGNFQALKTMNFTSVANVTSINHQGDTPSANKDRDSSLRINWIIENDSRENVVFGSAGPQDGRIGDCLFDEPEEVTYNLAQKVADPSDSNEKLLREHIERDPEVNDNQHSAKSKALVYDNPLFSKQNCPDDLAYERAEDVIESDSEHIASENYKNRVTHFTYLHPLSECCARTPDLNDALGSQHSSNFFVEAKNEHYNQGMVVRSEPSNEGKECKCEKEKSHLVESPSSANVNTLNQCNGKERISITGKNRGVSKEKDDSCDSVGSIYIKEPIVTGKRVVSFGEEILMGSKRIKKSSDKHSGSGPYFSEDSSFINWISSVTKCHFRPDNMKTHSLALVNKQRDVFSTAMSTDSTNDAASRSVGFGSIFAASYYPRLKGKPKAVSVDHPGESGSSKVLQFENKTVLSSADRMSSDDEQIKLHKPVPISNVRIEQGVCHLREPPSIVPNISLSSSPVQENVKHNMREHCGLHNVGSSTSYLQNGSSSCSIGKEASKLCPFIPYKSSNSSRMNMAVTIPASAWITRFSTKIAAPMKSTTECKQGTLLEAEKHVDDHNMFLNHSQGDIDSVRDCSNTEDYHQSPLDDQRRNSEHLQQYSISTTCCSKKVHKDQKAKSSLNPILPSHELKKLEPIISVFAKRLDAFRHIRTSEVTDNITLETPTCFFCGQWPYHNILL